MSRTALASAFARSRAFSLSTWFGFKRGPAGGGDGGADGARLRRRLFDQLVLLVVSPVLVLFVVLVPLAIAALPHHSTMCVYFESSHRSRTRSPDIAHRW